MQPTKLTDRQIVTLLAEMPIDRSAPPRLTGTEAKIAPGHLSEIEHRTYTEMLQDMIASGQTEVREGSSTAARMIFDRANRVALKVSL